MQMHAEARQWVEHFATDRKIRIVEIGSLNVNGTIRDLFPNADYTGIDRVAGPGVDVVCDAVDYVPESLVNMVICCEALEHTANWKQVIETANKWLHPCGAFVMTCAGLGRQPHSCDGGPLRDGEYYRNLSPADVREAMGGFTWKIVRQYQTDVQAFAVR
jgi:hypothetical protein